MVFWRCCNNKVGMIFNLFWVAYFATDKQLAALNMILRNFINCPRGAQEKGINCNSRSTLTSGVGTLESGNACYFNVHRFICALLIHIKCLFFFAY